MPAHKGFKHHNAKLTAEQIAEIIRRRTLADQVRRQHGDKMLAAEFNIHISTVRKIKAVRLRALSSSAQAG